MIVPSWLWTNAQRIRHIALQRCGGVTGAGSAQAEHCVHSFKLVAAELHRTRICISPGHDARPKQHALIMLPGDFTGSQHRVVALVPCLMETVQGLSHC